MKVKNYKLMYLYGAWITAANIYAETDAEAIFDAEDELKNKRAKQLRYALWDGNRMVKEF